MGGRVNRGGRSVDMVAFEREVVVAYPAVKWREPLHITVHDGKGGEVRSFGCRLCIAAFGMRGSDAAGFPKTEAEFERHIIENHPKEISDA